MSIRSFVRQRTFNVPALQERMTALRPIIESSLGSSGAQARAAAERSIPANSTETGYFFVAGVDLHANGKLCLRWRGRLRPANAVKNLFTMWTIFAAHPSPIFIATCLEFCSAASLDAKVVLSRFIQS